MEEVAVIFDLDGVLIDSKSDHLRSWQEFAKERGVDIPDDRFVETFGRQNRDAIPILFGGKRSEEEIHEMGERKEEIYRELATGRIGEIPGACNLVRSLAADDMVLAVGSSGHPVNVALALKELGISQIFKAVVTGHDVQCGKPDPEVFLTAASKLAVNPCRCVVIEDAPAGVEAAIAAGMQAIGLAGTHSENSLSGAHRVVGDLVQITPESIRSMVN